MARTGRENSRFKRFERGCGVLDAGSVGENTRADKAEPSLATSLFPRRSIETSGGSKPFIAFRPRHLSPQIKRALEPTKFPEAGIYAIVVCVKRDVTIHIGALGSLSFQKGLYAYVGSAQKNLPSRIQRHLRRAKKLRWHIDYLLANKHVDIRRILFRYSDKPTECAIARQLASRAKPVKGFGSSDCTCISHLFGLRNDLLLFLERLFE